MMMAGMWGAKKKVWGQFNGLVKALDEASTDIGNVFAQDDQEFSETQKLNTWAFEPLDLGSGS